MTTKFAPAVFAALVVATFGAFFAAQRFKHSPTVIQRFKATGRFSPNRDGRLDRERITFAIKETDDVTVDVVDARGDRARRLLDDRHLVAYQQLPTLRWDGRTDAGRRAPDGLYRARVTLRREGRSVVVPHAFQLDTTPPRPVVFAVGPQTSKVPAPELLPLPRGGAAVVHFRPAARRGEVLLFKTAPGRPRLVHAGGLPDGATTWRWHGLTRGRQASPGTYLVVIRSRDLAGNIGASVPIGRDGLPAIGYGGGAPGHGGITVRYVGVQAPGAPVAAGGIAEFYVDARRAAYTWGLRRAGGPPGSIRRGRGTRVRLRIHVPKGAAGVYLLTVRTARRQVRVPVAFGGRRPAGGTPAAPRGVLVVLPVMTWQGRNAVDDDGDGVPDTLSAGRPIRAARVLAGDGLPAGFATHEAPLLAFLDRRHRRYDITTDLALAAGAGPRLAAYRGVLLPGDTRWLPPAVGRALRGFARSGKTIVSVGTGSLRRLVHLTPGGRLVQPSVAAPTDLFGAHIVGLARGPVTLTNLRDQIGLFVGTTGLFTGVDPYEGTTGVGSQARLVASAVTPSGRAVIVAARFGKGLVIRTGMPSLATRLRSDPALATMTGRLWTLLSR